MGLRSFLFGERMKVVSIAGKFAVRKRTPFNVYLFKDLSSTMDGHMQPFWWPRDSSQFRDCLVDMPTAFAYYNSNMDEYGVVVSDGGSADYYGA